MITSLLAKGQVFFQPLLTYSSIRSCQGQYEEGDIRFGYEEVFCYQKIKGAIVFLTIASPIRISDMAKIFL